MPWNLWKLESGIYERCMQDQNSRPLKSTSLVYKHPHWGQKKRLENHLPSTWQFHRSPAKKKRFHRKKNVELLFQSLLLLIWLLLSSLLLLLTLLLLLLLLSKGIPAGKESSPGLKGWRHLRMPWRPGVSRRYGSSQTVAQNQRITTIEIMQ